MVQADGSLTQTDDIYSVKLVRGMLHMPPMSLRLYIYGWLALSSSSETLHLP